MERSKVNAYEIKITLKDSLPPIWRRVQVPSRLTLYGLHKVIQAVMGWQDYHLHYFLIDQKVYGDPEDDEYGDRRTIDDTEFKLSQVIGRAGQTFMYEYDFGDSWQHELKVEKVLELEKRLRAPVCVDGKRACPPEDVGGMHGYALFLEALSDPEHEEHDSYLTWSGEQFDPKAFDLKAANERLKHMNDEAIRDGYAQSAPDQALEHWLAGLTEEHSAWAENLAMRRNMVAMLQHIQANKVTGTSARGNFPLKAVRELAAQFVDPPGLEETIPSSYIDGIRSEEEVRPLYLLHMLGVISGLLEGGPSKRWRLSAIGENFLNAPPPVQAWVLFTTWWVPVNWMVRMPFGAQGNFIPGDYKNQCREALLGLVPGERVERAAFARRLLEKARLGWSKVAPEHQEEIQLSFVKTTLLDPLLEFELLTGEYEPPDKKYYSPRLVAFRVKTVARVLLEATGAIPNLY